MNTHESKEIKGLPFQSQEIAIERGDSNNKLIKRQDHHVTVYYRIQYKTTRLLCLISCSIIKGNSHQ